MEIQQSFEQLSDQELEERATDFRNNGQIADAAGAYKELAKRFEKQGDLVRAANMQHMIGVSYKVANDTDSSLAALVDAKHRYEQVEDRVGVGRVLRDEGITYQYIHDYDRALPLLKQSVEELKESNDPAELGISEAKLGNLYTDQGNLNGAEIWIQQGLKTLLDTNHWFYIATARMHLAGLLCKKQQYVKALREIELAERAFIEHGGESTNARRMAQIEAMKTAIYIQKGDHVKAEHHKLRSLELLTYLDTDSAKYLRDQPEFKNILNQ